MWPAEIDFKRGGYITGIIGIVMMPWKLLADPSGYIFTWLIGYSALLGPVIAHLVDYFLIREPAWISMTCTALMAVMPIVPTP
jgi:NCS1 family nucleobase:cation symporter-1